MSSPPSSTDGEHAPRSASVSAAAQHPAHLHRSFTLPPRMAAKPAARSSSTSSADGIETLFICPQAKIVSFTATAPTKRRSPSRLARRELAPASTIAWTTPTERTLAVGALRIYRVTTSNVSFLNSGHLLHTIFPRSQCWCVDNQSVFVLRIRQDSYYRMELPYETDEDKDSIAQFKSVLAQVLQYEKTRCPFARGFEVQVEQAERPKSPPRPRSKQQSTQRAKKWLFDKSWVPESGRRASIPMLEGPGSDAGSIAGSVAGSAAGSVYGGEDDRSSIYTDGSEAVLESNETVAEMVRPRQLPRRPSIAERASVFEDLSAGTTLGRTGRAMSISSMQRIPESPTKVEQPKELTRPLLTTKSTDNVKPALGRHISEANSMVSSSDSFYSLASTLASTQCSPSPRFVDAESDVLSPWADGLPQREPVSRGRSIHRRQISEITVRQSSGGYADKSPITPRVPPIIDVHPSSAPSTPPLIDDSDNDSVDLPALDIPTPPDAIRMKRLTGASQRRAFSPMPHVQTLFRPRRRNTSREFTTALVRKTCELVLGPPAHIVSLMLRIARSISNGFGFMTYRVQSTEQIPCAWESDDDLAWPEEDDFGIPLTNVGGQPSRRRTFSGEVD